MTGNIETQGRRKLVIGLLAVCVCCLSVLFAPVGAQAWQNSDFDNFKVVKLDAGSSPISETYQYDSTGYTRQAGELDTIRCFENGRKGDGEAISGKRSAWIRLVTSVSGTLTATLTTEAYFGMVDFFFGQPSLGEENFQTLAPEHNCAFDRFASQNVATVSEQVQPNVPVWIETNGAEKLEGPHTEERSFATTGGPTTLALRFTPADGDGDGTPDTIDACPTLTGPSTTGGCPDRDGDGIPDGADKCPEFAGPGRFEGCPDRDNDGLPDRLDRCAGEAGPEREVVFGITINLDGCPDSDRDGVPNNADLCPGITADALIAEPGDGRHGCLEPLSVRLILKYTGATRRGARVTVFNIVGAPVGSRITLRCRGRACPHSLPKTMTTTQPVAPLLPFLHRGALRRGRLVWIPVGTSITVVVTHEGALGRMRSYAPTRGRKVKEVDHCVAPNRMLLSCPGPH